MKRQIVFCAVLFMFGALPYKASAQSGEYFTNGKGQAFTQITRTDVEGSPFLVDKWLSGKAETVKGMIYDNIKLKYEIYEDYVIFAYDTADEPLKFSDPIKTFLIYTPTPMLFSNGFPAIDKQTPESYYQVLSNGDMKLLKRVSKIINETKSYGTGSAVTKVFQNVNMYYIFINNKLEKADNPKKMLYAFAGDKKAQLDEFAKANSINFKRDEDLSKIFDFYNTFKK